MWARTSDPNRHDNARRSSTKILTRKSPCESGEPDYDGHISRRGDARLRSLLYEAAAVILTRVHTDSDLRRWGLALKKRFGFKRAAVALARKLAVILHAMLKTGTDFDPTASASVT